MPQLIEEEVAALATMSLAQLRAKWREVVRSPIPKVSIGVLRMAVAYELQAWALGDLSRDARRTLDECATGKRRTLSTPPGTRLAREWKGTVHIVTIADDGSIRWNDRTWRSLSEVARAITGTRWSGPLFFGLKQGQRR
jgi:hypothetical protein